MKTLLELTASHAARGRTDDLWTVEPKTNTKSIGQFPSDSIIFKPKLWGKSMDEPFYMHPHEPIEKLPESTQKPVPAEGQRFLQTDSWVR